MSPEDKPLEIGSTYLSNDELGVLNDVGDVQLEGRQSTRIGFVPFHNDFLTLADSMIVNMPFSWVIHSFFPCLPPTLCQSVGEFRKAVHDNGDLRGREELIGHTIRQVGTEDLKVLRFKRLLELIGKLAFSGHGWE